MPAIKTGMTLTGLALDPVALYLSAAATSRQQSNVTTRPLTTFTRRSVTARHDGDDDDDDGGGDDDVVHVKDLCYRCIAYSNLILIYTRYYSVLWW